MQNKTPNNPHPLSPKNPTQTNFICSLQNKFSRTSNPRIPSDQVDISCVSGNKGYLDCWPAIRHIRRLPEQIPDFHLLGSSRNRRTPPAIHAAEEPRLAMLSWKMFNLSQLIYLSFNICSSPLNSNRHVYRICFDPWGFILYILFMV